MRSTANGPAAFNQLRILHAALTASVLIYGAVVYLAVEKADPRQPEPENAQTLVIILGVVALSVMGTIPVIRTKVMPPSPTASTGGSAAPGVFPGGGSSGASGGLSPAERAKLFTGSIVTWAMCESIAVFGVVASFMTHRGWPFPIFAAVSLANFVIYRPRPSPGA